MQRAFAMLSIVILLFMQSTPSTMQFISATTKDDNQFTVNVDNDSTQEKAKIEIKSIADNNFDLVTIFLPKESQYDDQLAIEQEAVEITYQEENHSLMVQWDKDQEQNVTFNLIDLIHANNSLTIQGIISDEIIIEESHDFTVVEAEEVESSEEDQDSEVASDENNADETDLNDEGIVESKGSEPKGESDSSDSNEGSKGESEGSKSNEELETQSVGSKSDVKVANESDDSESTTLGDLNTYLGIGPIFETALSGADADFRLTLKLTGSKRTYKNVNVVVDLPLTEYVTFDDSAENLEHLAIDGVSPTFDSDESQLIYHFEEIKRGQMYEKIISLNTKNGYIPNNTAVEVEASITGEVHYTENDEKEEAEKGDVVPFEYADHGSIDIKASGALNLSKFQVDEGENNKRDGSIVNRGEEVLWKLELEIPKKDRGQLFLNPDEKITITDTMPSQLEYVEVISADQPKSVEGNVITWEFSADDFETQKNKGKTLFTKDIVIKTKVKDNVAKGQITNSATASATFINDNQVTDDASRNVLVATDNPSSGEIEGSVVRPAHLGPDPSAGNGLGTNDKKNPNPTVTDDAILKFSHGIAALLESYPDGKNKPAKNFKEFQTFYEIDANLNLESMRVPGPFRYQPNNSYPNDEYFNVQPRYDIKAKIDGGSFQTLVAADDVIPGKTYTREELGLTPGQKVSEIKIEFLKGYNGNQDEVAPGGLRSQYTVLYEFSIDEGFTGTVENKFNITGVNGNNERFDDRVKNPDVYDNSKPSDIAGPRQATVVGYGENPKPVGRVGVKLLEDVRGVVTLGKNRMQVELVNVNNSGAPMNSQLETVVLLPPGVMLHDEVNPSYTNAEGDPTDAASNEIVEDDYNGSGRQLIKIKWDDGRITKGQSLQAELDVYIRDDAPNQLQFDVYGFSSDEGLQAPSTTGGGVTDTVLQSDTENFYGNGEDHPRLKSGNIYTLAGKYDIQTEKLIKGPNDEDYSKFTTAPFEGTVDYKLKMTNTTGKDLSIMTLIDVLPTVGDLGITDNINRGSTFDPILDGPIKLPQEWQGKVNVYYSTAKNPERDDLTRHTDYLPNTPQLTNPEGAEAPNWIQESEISDWSTIHSFKIELQKGDTWIKGQDIEIDFSMKMPNEEDVADEVKNLDLVPHQRAAWNSFAVATDTGQPVEPERVGVALELDPPATPDVEKEVEGNDGEYGKDLVEKEFEKEYNYQVNTEVPENLQGFEYLTLTDTLDDRLDVVGAVALVDGEEVDYKVTIDGQLVTLLLDRTQLDEISGQRLTLQITAKIKEGTEVQIINNKAEIQVNDNPSEDSNDVPVNPPPVKPEIEKDIDGEKAEEAVEKLRGEVYEYNVTSTLPENVTGYKTVNISDELDDRLTIESTKVLVDGESSDIEAVTDGQLVTVSLDEDQIKELAGAEIKLVIAAKINEDVEIEIIDNEASIQVNDNPEINSNKVPVTPPPPVTPDVEKEVEDSDGDYSKELVEKEREKEYNYRVNTLVPEKLQGYEHITLADELDERLEVKGAVALVDGKEVDYEVTIEDQLVTLRVEREQLDKIAGQELTLQITAQIKAGVEVEVIDNEATIQVNNNPTESSNKVPVIPPPETPNVEKEVEGNDGAYGKELVEKELEKEYNYRVNTIVPEDLRGYEHITLADELDDRLEVLGAIALVDGEEVDYEVIIEDQLVTLRVEREQLDEIAGQELTLQITAQIKAGVEVEVIDNEATIQVNDNPTKESNKVPVIPPPKIEKDIDGEKAVEPVEKLRGQEYDYNVTTRLPEDVSGFETVLISDDLDERLTVVDAKVLVDGEASDIQVNIDGQLVTVLLENEEIEPFAGKEIKLVITAKINADVEVEVIDNQASIQVNDNPKVDSNKVPVIPPTTPNIEKDVEGTDHLDIDFNKEYNYNIVTELPSNIKDYERYVITDNVDPGLVVMADQVVATVDGETYDGLELTVDGNKVEVVVTDFAGLDGKEQIELVIPAKIHPDTNIDEYTDNQIPNTVDLDFTNESDEDSKITTKPVTVTPPPTPDVEKEVEDNNGDYGKDLVEKEREKDYNYRVNTVVPEDLTSFVDLTLADELDERLDVKGAVALVDGEEVDYEVVIEGQLVTLKVDREQLDEIAGQELTLQITAQIKAGVEVEVIDNQATIQVNDNPSKNSNKVPVIPPPETPDVEKEVEGNDGEYGKNLVEKEREKDYNYRVNTVVPEDLRGYEHITLADELDDRLEVKGAVALVDGEEVDYEVVIDGQLVTLKVDREQLDEIAGQELTLQITAQIKAGVEVEVIDNEATIQVNNNPTENSNKVPVIPPPETPDVEKEVEDNDGEYGKDLVEKERENDYNYRVNTVVPEDLRGYEHITLADELDQRLDVKGAVALVNGEEVDYEITIDGQLVTLKLDRAQLDEIAGQELTLQITAQIKAGVEVEVIDNEATIQVNDNPTKNSNKVPVIPPPETPDVEKEVEGNDGSYGKELVEKKREKDYNYRVNTVIPDDLRGYEHITLADELDERLEVMSAVALVNGEEVDYEVIIDGQLVTLKVDREQLDEIAGQELTLQITAQIKAGVEVEIIDNQATIQVNDNPTENSNVVPVIPEDPPRLPTINKDVEGMDHLDIDYDKEYQYNIITKLPSNIEDYEAFVITDTVDKGLEVISEKVTVTVDGEAYDGLVLTVDGNNVKVEVTDFAGLKGKEQIELVITAKIHPDTNMDDYVDNKIPNTATLEFTNESGEEGQIETKPVTVTPPTPEDPGSELPKTATNTFNLQLIGLGIILVGLLLLFVRRKRI